MGKYFGTDGVRGVAGEKLSPSLAYRIGEALAEVLVSESNDKPIIFVGMDTRLSGPMLENALLSGIAAAGGIGVNLGILPTPGVSYIVRAEQGSAGVVISASHNPFYDNGIKIFGGDGKKFSSALEEIIEQYIDGERTCTPKTGTDLGTVIDGSHLAFDYCSRLKKLFPLDLSPYKIVLDTANGATSDFAPEIFESLGAEVIPLSADYDGVNINNKCGSTCPEAMSKAVVENGADLGIAYDGDGDRVIFADSDGEIVNGDGILAILALFLKEKGELANDCLVATVMSNLGLTLTLKKAGVKLYAASVGDKFVMEEMDKRNAVLGGEQSGHIILSQYNPTGDGMLTSLMICRVMTETKKPLNILKKVINPLPQVLINVPSQNRKEWESCAALVSAKKNAEEKLGSNGRILIRPSGTEPLLRIMGEGPDKVELNGILKNLAEIAASDLG